MKQNNWGKTIKNINNWKKIIINSRMIIEK